MPAQTTKEIMPGIPVSLNAAWQLAKRQPEFWIKFAPQQAQESDCKTTRIRLPEEVYAYVMSNKADIAVPVAHTVSALLYLAFTDLSNALYDPEYANSIDKASDNNTQAA